MSPASTEKPTIYSSSFISSSIAEIIAIRLIPWIKAIAAEQLVVAQPRLKKMKPVTDLPLTPKKLQGPRKAVRAFTVSGVTARWPSDNLIETHTPLLLFVLSGIADLHCGDYILHLPQDHAVLIPGQVPRWAGGEDIEYLSDNPKRFCDNILFNERCGSLEIWLNHDRGNQHFRSGLHEAVVVHNARLIRLLEEIQEEAVAQRANSTAICHHLLEVFLLMLQRDLQENKAIHPGRLKARDADPRSHHAPIQQARQYVRDHLHEHLTQDKVARLVRMSRTQFIRRFREESGQTFNQFVTECRMKQALIFLENTDFPLTFIQKSLGYKSAVHFNKIFRKHIGMLPSAYRAQKRDQ